MNLDSLHPLAGETPGSFVCQSQVTISFLAKLADV